MAFLAQSMGVLEVAKHADAPDHNVPADLVHVERRADRPQHQDRQRPAEVLAELVEAIEHVGCPAWASVPPSRCWPSSGT